MKNCFTTLGPVQEILVLIKHDLSHPFSMDAKPLKRQSRLQADDKSRDIFPNFR